MDFADSCMNEPKFRIYINYQHVQYNVHDRLQKNVNV